MIEVGCLLKIQDGVVFWSDEAFSGEGVDISSTGRENDSGRAFGTSASAPRHAAISHRQASAKTKLLLIFPAPLLFLPSRAKSYGFNSLSSFILPHRSLSFGQSIFNRFFLPISILHRLMIRRSPDYPKHGQLVVDKVK